MLKVREYQTSEVISKYRKRLRQQGYVFHGSGVYAHVYINEKYDPNNVLKIGSIIDTPDHDGWLQWALGAVRSPRNPWLPKIEQIRLCRYDDNLHFTTGDWGYYVAKMERLHKLPWRHGAALADEINEVVDLLGSPDRTLPFAITVGGNKHLVAACELIADICHDHTSVNAFLPDIHHQNIMQRDNGHIVITDPIQ